MSWTSLLGHDYAIERFRRAVEKNRLASTYLLVGPSGIGKRKFATMLAQSLLCETNPESKLDPCGQCPSCQQVVAGTHPDVITVKKPDDKNFVPVELLIGSREKRMREGLCYEVSRKPFRGGRKVAIIDDADFFNQEGANALLKTLEEPPPRSLLLLIGTSERRQLATIRSRSQLIRFQPLAVDQVATILREQNLVEDVSKIDLLSKLSNGSIDRALTLDNVESLDYRNQLYEQLRSNDPTRDNFAKTTEEFVDAAGKEAAIRRDRIRRICEMAIDFYRETMIEMADEKQSDAYAACIHRCLEAQQHATANMSPANLIETWLSDLGRLSRFEVTN